MRLLKTSTLIITRYETSSGYYDSNNMWVEGTTAKPITIEGSIQPFNKGNNQIDLPDGVRGDAAVFIYTKTKVRSQDDVNSYTADTTLIDGNLYECFYVEDWSRYNLKAVHYKAVFIRKDKLGGTL